MFSWRALPPRPEATAGAYLTVPSLARAGIRVAFTGRAGGARAGGGALNVSFLAGDDPEVVRANRAIASAAVGAQAADWVRGAQVHGIVVASAGAEDRGRGANDRTEIDGVDALWTGTPGLPLAVLTADCVPVALADVEGRRVGVVHAGWRGLVGGIVGAAVAEMGEPERLVAFAGPSIGPCCYEVGPEVTERARAALGEEVVRIASAGGDRVTLDLWRGTRIALRAAGVREVWNASACTRCEPHRFFSHRAGDRARQALVAMVETG